MVQRLFGNHIGAELQRANDIFAMGMVGDGDDHAFGRRLAQHQVEISRRVDRYREASLAGDSGGVRQPARIAVAQADKTAIGGVLTEQCVQKHVGAVPEADDRVADAHRCSPQCYFSPVLAMPWIR